VSPVCKQSIHASQGLLWSIKYCRTVKNNLPHVPALPVSSYTYSELQTGARRKNLRGGVAGGIEMIEYPQKRDASSSYDRINVVQAHSASGPRYKVNVTHVVSVGRS